jgi:hypothetical protein
MAKKIKKEKIIAVSIRLPESLYLKLSDRAEKQKRSVNNEMHLIVEKEFA